jgi:hypothetical protein
MKHKILKYYAYGVGIIALITISAVFYWTFYPYKIITFTGEKNKIITPIVYQGGEGSYKTTYCKYSNPKVTKERFFVDDMIYQTETASTKLPMGCHTSFVSFKVPLTLPAGTYHIKTIAHYQVNFLRKITIIRETDNFNVKGEK